MEGDFIKINKWLLPLSWLYGLGVKLRNTMFEIGILKSRAFQIPVISVGNITVGGSGKTPHVEYLIDILKDLFHVAVLSRGYKRKSKGFIQATADTVMSDIGDEPYQMKQKFPKVTIAVDKDRCHGIDLLTELDAKLDVVLLDDAFQHRYVKPGINILLVDYHRLIIYDKLLPAGRLREPMKGKNRADIVIVTKCPKSLKPMEFRVITKAMALFPYQHLFFTTLSYDAPVPVFPQEAVPVPTTTADDGSGFSITSHVLLLTGIASPRQLEEDLADIAPRFSTMTFPDHHDFTRKDVERINRTFADMPSPKCIVTTEKDAARLTNTDGLSNEVRQHLFTLPIHIKFMQEQQEQMFNENIIGYVHKNSRNSILVKGADDHKPKNSHHPGNRPRTISFRNN